MAGASFREWCGRNLGWNFESDATRLLLLSINGYGWKDISENVRLESSLRRIKIV